MQLPISDLDPFDLPEWLGTGDVVWQADGGLKPGPLLPGRLSGDAGAELPCDLMAVDEAYPEPVTDDVFRQRAHQAWRHDQVLIADRGGRLTIAVPGTRLGPELAMDALGRLARAVGARPEQYAVLLRIGG